MFQTLRGALPVVTELAMVSDLAVARAVATDAVVAAVSWARERPAVLPHAVVWTHTHQVDAGCAVAAVGTHLDAAVVCAPSHVTLTHAFYTATVVAAVFRTCLEVTCAAGIAGLTIACAVETVTMLAAIPGTRVQ